MVDASQSTDPNAERTDRLERYRVRIGLIQAIVVTFITGGIAVAIPASIDAYRAYLERERANREFDIKLLEMRNSYTSGFLDQSMNQDIEIRLRLSEYFSFVADEASRKSWEDFHKALDARRTEVRQRIREKEEAIDKLTSLTELSIEQQINLADLERELNWDYAEVGYVRRDTNVTAPKFDTTVTTDRAAIPAELEELFSSVEVNQSKAAAINLVVDKIIENKRRYKIVSDQLGVPWYFVATVHALENNLDFERHLNGDPLSARTVHIPKDRPTEGTPPFTWEASAIDTLKLTRLNVSADGTIGQVLYALETYYGLGYRRRQIRTPFLWACTNHEMPGRLIGSYFDPKATFGFCGGAAILKTLATRGEISTGSPMAGAQ